MPQHERAPSSWPWPYPRWQRWLIELVSLAVILGLLALAVTTVRDNLRAQQIASGFGFLQREAGFAIAETPIAYSPADSYARALAVGLVNTVRVSLPALFGATVLGVLLAVALRSAQPLARRGARVYVECFRNTPLLLQLFLWYALLTTLLPPPRQAWQPLAAVFVSNRGLYLPVPLEPGPWLWAL
ncbi:MAG TPA: ABC transporter permease subunit, partial [Plasticicumulans sp.]|nr:ABC transporter permease subunit [Plasticicumulans sp.]